MWHNLIFKSSDQSLEVRQNMCLSVLEKWILEEMTISWHLQRAEFKETLLYSVKLYHSVFVLRFRDCLCRKSKMKKNLLELTSNNSKVVEHKGSIKTSTLFLNANNEQVEFEIKNKLQFYQHAPKLLR